jgi:nitrite reductase (NO-forming)
MSILFSYTWYFILQAFGLAVAFLFAAIFIYIVLRRLHSRWTTVALLAVFLGVSLFLYVPNGLPHGLQYPFSLTTYGPSTGPGLPFANILAFFKNFNRFAQVSDIAHDPNDIPPPLTRTTSEHVKIDVTAKEVIATMAPGVYLNYWTFDGKVPGPFFRVREGDTVELTLHNDPTSLHHHSIDLHAVTGPGGGASATMVAPGEAKTITFKALHPGLFVYHCAEPNVATHMAHGMYGLILVEPKEGLPKVDKELYVMQGEFYETGNLGRKGLQLFDTQAMLDGKPQYIVFNGRTGALANSMNAKVGDTVRVYFGNGGVNLISSFHVIGEVFDHVFPEASLTASPLTHVQTTLVPAGGATVVDFDLNVPGNYPFVDHALARLDRGAWGVLRVTGPENKEIYDGVVMPGGGH